MCRLYCRVIGGKSDCCSSTGITEHLHVQVHSSSAHTASANALSFAPHELGLALAAASSDGSVSVLTHTADAGWHTEKVMVIWGLGTHYSAV